MTWVCKRGSTSGAALTLSSKDDLIDDEEPPTVEIHIQHISILMAGTSPVPSRLPSWTLIVNIVLHGHVHSNRVTRDQGEIPVLS